VAEKTKTEDPKPEEPKVETPKKAKKDDGSLNIVKHDNGAVQSSEPKNPVTLEEKMAHSATTGGDLDSR
jgi:hypothetical protein